MTSSHHHLRVYHSASLDDVLRPITFTYQYLLFWQKRTNVFRDPLIHRQRTRQMSTFWHFIPP